MDDPRPSWDEYFMRIAFEVAGRSTCLRRQVGAVIVKDKRILATGYNGAPPGMPHCLDIGCLREELGIPSGERQELCRGLHAEQNAILQAASYGVPIKGGEIYVTHRPCVTCAKMIVAAGLKRVVYAGEYPDELGRSILEQAGVELVKFEKALRPSVNG